ncbi:hypothetical protein F3Y22_tig00116995pilonHSYRG00020 [Hibiscus syriacus]|uniref:EXPERA domain-containing protein n=1 Tax=Hibiscus syriacus TaxID=106335 RepID=A0A6A2XG09_HIBSY|nr:uncharacterized protein LOC120193372 isoform X3 [Hibiscus syriacus]KAE8657389.1 hypothetical protein F3Y22_tig00116995pilonHSYRG00020 [Hibiscus syriacus]
MGNLGQVVNALLLLEFFSILVIVPLDIPESILPYHLNPLYRFYTTISRDYLVLDKPPFFMALMMLELFYLFPLAVLNIYGMLTAKPWFNSTCLLFGASLITSTTAMLGDILGSDKPSADFMAKLYSPFIALGALTVLRGLVPQRGTATPIIGNGPGSALKKKA